MKKIKLTTCEYVKVSDEDYEYLMRFSWYASGSMPYALRCVKGGNEFMHKVIAKQMGLNVEDKIDHIDGDTFNNQRDNLRPSNSSLNGGNRRLNSNNSTGFKGVSEPRPGRFVAKCKRIPLGTFDTAEEAARHYDNAARIVFKESARLNFPRKGERGVND